MYQAMRPYMGLVIGVSLVVGACGGSDLDITSAHEQGKAEVLDEFMVHGMNTAEESWAFSITSNTIQASCAAGKVIMEATAHDQLIYTAYDTGGNWLGKTEGWRWNNDSVQPSLQDYVGEEAGKKMIRGFVAAMEKHLMPDEELAEELSLLVASYNEGGVEGINQWLDKNFAQNLKRLMILTGTILVAGMVGVALPGLGAMAIAASLALFVECIYGMYLSAYGTGEGPTPDLIHLGSCDPRIAECAIEPMFEVMI